MRAIPEAVMPEVVNGGTSPHAKSGPWFQKKDDVFSTVASLAAICLYDSDMKRDARGQAKEGAVASGATNWIDDRSAFALKNALDKVKLKVR